MHRKPRAAATAAVLSVAAVITAILVIAGGATAAPYSPVVSIRIEGAKKTLLTARPAKIPSSGSITKNGAPKGACPADSAAGVLNTATKGRWSGSFSTKYHDYLITQILGDTESGTKSYWEILVNNVAAQTGACEIKLRPGDRLVFAAVSLKGTGYPLAITAPAHATAGKAFTVKVVDYNAKGKAVPLAGAVVKDGHGSVKTNAKGIATVTDAKAGTLVLGANKTGYVRAAAVSVKVTS
jgi:hypothetical protein